MAGIAARTGPTIGTISRSMVHAVDSEGVLTELEQDASILHEHIARLVRDASTSSVLVGGTCGIVSFSTPTFGGESQVRHYYSPTGTNELYEEADTNCADGELLSPFFDPTGSTVSFDNGLFEWSMVLVSEGNLIPVRIVAAPRNL